MAHLLPDSPAGTLPPAVLRVFRLMKSLPDDWQVWHHLAPWAPEAPDFLLVHPTRQAALVKVSGAMQAEADSAAQLLLVGAQKIPLGQAENQVLADFASHLDGIPVSKIVIFPNIPEKHLHAARTRLNIVDSPPWWGQEAMHDAARWAQAFDQPALDEIAFEHLRLAFTPEVEVPAALTVRPPVQRRLEAGLTGYLLDELQEAALKADLDLNPAGQRISKELHTSVVNGVAGSGKTLILLYRLRLLQAFFPQKRFLVLTHNRPLLRDIMQRFQRLTGALPKNIEWRTFFSWCHQNWPKDQHPWITPAGLDARLNIARSVLDSQDGKPLCTPDTLLSEVDWFKDQLIENQEDYLNTDRRGRGFRLSSEQRKRMAQAILQYEARLHDRPRLDWGDIPAQLLRWQQDKTLVLPQYDVILVDEAQFFAPIWFELLLHTLRPRDGHIFLVADPTQGFLGRGMPWKAVGLDVRGRSHALQRSYRTTREILNFATLFFRQRQQTSDPEEDLLAADLSELPGGLIPILLPLDKPQDEIARIANEIKALADQRFPLGQILVLHADWSGCEQLLAALRARLGPNAAHDPKAHSPGNFVRVTTLNAGTGLESPVVFLAGLRQLFEREQSLRISEDERDQLIRENTRKIYMALTRAGQRLVITYPGKLPEPLNRLFSNGSPQ
jgi:superfamily I DNA/RNA helicase